MACPNSQGQTRHFSPRPRSRPSHSQERQQHRDPPLGPTRQRRPPTPTMSHTLWAHQPFSLKKKGEKKEKWLRTLGARRWWCENDHGILGGRAHCMRGVSGPEIPPVNGLWALLQKRMQLKTSFFANSSTRNLATANPQPSNSSVHYLLPNLGLHANLAGGALSLQTPAGRPRPRGPELCI